MKHLRKEINDDQEKRSEIELLRNENELLKKQVETLKNENELLRTKLKIESLLAPIKKTTVIY